MHEGTQLALLPIVRFPRKKAKLQKGAHPDAIVSIARRTYISDVPCLRVPGTQIMLHVTLCEPHELVQCDAFPW